MNFKIGTVEMNNNVVLAPMAGIGNSAFRRIIKEMGAGLLYSEMVSDKAIFFNNKKTLNLLFMTEEERPITQQIFGSDVDSFVYAAKIIADTMNPDIIDINMGCPVPKVAVKSQAGSALLKDIKKIEEIIRSVVAEVSCPITVKIRSGWDENSINTVEVAKVCEKAGASAICVHPRTRKQGYSGKSDWNIIKEVKKNVNIPVIGNGDINTPEDAKRMILETNCDAIMVGRAALKNPFLIEQIISYLENDTYEKVSIEQKINLCIKHLGYLLEIKPEKRAILEMRSHAARVIKGQKGSSLVKNKIFKAQTKEELIDIFEKYKKELKNTI